MPRLTPRNQQKNRFQWLGRVGKVCNGSDTYAVLQITVPSQGGVLGFSALYLCSSLPHSVDSLRHVAFTTFMVFFCIVQAVLKSRASPYFIN